MARKNVCAERDDTIEFCGKLYRMTPAGIEVSRLGRGGVSTWVLIPSPTPALLKAMGR